jgi:hypothetical protein
LLPAYANLRWYWLITTDRRIVFMGLNSLGTKPTGIDWQRLLHEVSVVAYRNALLTQLLELRRNDDGAIIRFRSSRYYRASIRAITARLGG